MLFRVTRNGWFLLLYAYDPEATREGEYSRRHNRLQSARAYALAAQLEEIAAKADRCEALGVTTDRVISVELANNDESLDYWLTLVTARAQALGFNVEIGPLPVVTF